MKAASSLVPATAPVRDAELAVEKRLIDEQSDYRDLLQAAPDAIVVLSQHGEIVLLNLQAEKQFGYHRDELLGQAVTHIIPEGFAERLIADDLRSVEDALAQQIGTGIELVGRHKDGSKFPIELMLSPLKSAESILVIAAIRDISARNLVDDERKRVTRLKDEFVSTVSHELRTPLTSISGSISLLMANVAGELPAPGPRLLSIAHQNCQRLARLVDDILDVGKMEAGQVVYRFTCVEVRALVAQAIEANRGYAEGYRVQIRLDDSSALGEVRADRDRLSQVVTNLLSNAIKFSAADDEVLVSTEHRSNAMRISVRNRGARIPDDFKPYIFQRFMQADATNTREKGGTGLGLCIVKQIVDRLGGEVDFAEELGQTLFYVELPCWDHLGAIDRDAPPKAQRILLCEDDPDTAIVLREQLGQFGFATDFAYTAADAIILAAATPYCVVLTDLQLPDGNGIDLIVQLRCLPEYGEVPIIVVSADPTSGRSDSRSSELKVFHWLSKPVDFDYLMKVLPKQPKIVD